MVMKTLILFSLFIIPVCLAAQTPVPPGPVSGTWDLAGSPYMVNGEININEDSTLVIEPGVEVRFTGWYKFIVKGSLLAEGTETDQILFTADDTNNRWYGIRFFYATGTSVLDHCIVEYGQTMLSGSVPDPDYMGGGILLYYSGTASITIKNSIIRNNTAYYGGGIEIYSTYPLIENCEITGNEAEWGGGIDAMSMYSTAIIKNCLVAYNAGNSGGGISAGGGSKLEIRGNVIKHNSSSRSGGIRVVAVRDLLVSGNIIAHNHAWVNAGGIGVWLTDTIVPVFKDNTIAYNHAIEDGGGVFVAMNCSPSFESDIIYFNSSGNAGMNQVHLDGTGGAPFFNYCDVKDSVAGFSGPGAQSFPWETNYLHCIDADPLFADAANDDFNLTWTNYPEPDNTMSPCIDRGCQGMFPEPDGTCNDIGAYFFFQQIDIPEVLPPISVSQTSFMAMWDPAYGALYYLLDVAEDEAFTNFVLQDEQVYDTEYTLTGLTYGQSYYYRVRAENTGVTSDYSATMGNPVNILESQPDFFKAYSYAGTIKINIKDEAMKTREIQVYNMLGKLLVRQGLLPGSNVIDPGVENQVVILHVTADNKRYTSKLFVR